MLGTWHGGVLTRGKKFFELTNHLGNVMVTVTDRKQQVPKNDSVINYFEPDVATANDYYPFGMLQPGRNYNASGVSDYRYGFNGKENDNEVKGEGDQLDYGMRIYDSRVGRFLSVDPLIKKYSELTPYQFASNRVIEGIDLDGKEYLHNEKSVYLLHQFRQTDKLPYVHSDLWIKDTRIDNIVMGVPDPPEGDDDSEPKLANIRELKGGQLTSRKQVWAQKQDFKNAARDLRGDAIGLVLEAAEGLYSTIYRKVYNQEILRGGRSIHAVNDADNLLRTASQLPGFPDEQLKPFESELVNYLTDGTVSENATINKFITTWGDLIYKKREAILNKTYSFEAEQTVVETHESNDGNTGRRYTTTTKAGNPDPDLKAARETLKDAPKPRESSVGSSNN